jgi:hypothetical protein
VIAKRFAIRSERDDGVYAMTMKLLKGAVVLVAAATCATAQFQGPSATAPCYILPNAELPTDSVRTMALLTVGDAAPGYRMVGLPDGMGLWGNAGAASLMVEPRNRIHPRDQPGARDRRAPS